MSEEAGPQRIDKWLWFARLAKTRTTAQKLVLSGAVRVNRDRIDSASRLVRVGDVLTVALERQVRVLKVLAPGVRRGPAPEAQKLYEDVTPPAPIRPASGGERPTKRDRRAIDAFHSAGSALGGTVFRDDGDD
ncbi:RNA-binding S4 domain-containing protein [Mesorhizobium sp. BR1-1-16]|uniref:RNA-binding S4 domain-containing protein n=1 Tax=Mesorhizobium sp. BR1-1-16 TaxID=2876653 RepID=UPI001CCA7C29|nr:RNA-binding S4 domain-containing protein [Mesorhizobium sp. BR1-1-16]MBZ9937379.1 RNA-binding S4 domain-containing protein [Mesorhizobium sp. BR1-1-16]